MRIRIALPIYTLGTTRKWKEWSTSGLSRFISEVKASRAHCLAERQNQCGRFRGKISFQSGFKPRTVQPVAWPQYQLRYTYNKYKILKYLLL